jgi:methylglyoxal synthase
LIAHDGKKDDMVRFTREHKEQLAPFALIATGTTGDRVRQATGLAVERMFSGPYGGDAQIAARSSSSSIRSTPIPTSQTSRACCASATCTMCR